MAARLDADLGGIRSVERNARIRQIEIWMAEQWPGDRLAQKIMERFGVAKRTAYADIAIVYTRCHAETAAESKIRLGRARWSWQEQFRRCVDRGDMSAANYALDRLTKLDGLYAPKKIEVGGSINVGMQIQGYVGVLDKQGLAALEIVMDQIERARTAGLLPEPTPIDGDDVIDVGPEALERELGEPVEAEDDE